MIAQLSEVRCPDCGKLLFKAIGPFDVEIMCSGTACKATAKTDGRSRIKRLTWPNAAVKNPRI